MESFYVEKSKKKLFIVMGIFVMLATGAVFGGFILDSSKLLVNQNQEIPMSEVSELENLVEEGPLEKNKASNNSASKDEFVFVINKKIVFKDSNSLGDIKIENPASNEYNFYVEIKLKDDDEVIYKSPIIEPNHHIKNDYLIKKLSKGQYNSVATVFVIDSETDQVVAEQQTNIEITIKK